MELQSRVRRVDTSDCDAPNRAFEALVPQIWEGKVVLTVSTVPIDTYDVSYCIGEGRGGTYVVPRSEKSATFGGIDKSCPFATSHPLGQNYSQTYQ